MWAWWRSPEWLSDGVSGVLGAVGWLLAQPCWLPGTPGMAGGQGGVTPIGMADRRRCWAGSAAQRQGPQPGERTGERGCPRPGGLQPQDEAAGVAGHAGGDMQQPVAQGLGLGHRERTVQQQRLGPAAKVLGGQDQLQPNGVAPHEVERQVLEAGGLGGADAVLDPGALAVAQLQPGQAGVGLVGDKTWKRCPSWSVKRSWAPGWASSRRHSTRVPAGQLLKSTQPVSSQTSAPGRICPSGSTAGVHAGSG